MLVNTAIWAALIIAGVCFALLKPKVFMKAVSAVSALVLVMEGTALLFSLNANRMSANLTAVYCSDEDYFTFSDNGDVVVIMLDTFDNRMLEQAAAQDPDYADVFRDFTFYENTSSSYGKTAGCRPDLLGDVVPNPLPGTLSPSPCWGCYPQTPSSASRRGKRSESEKALLLKKRERLFE